MSWKHAIARKYSFRSLELDLPGTESAELKAARWNVALHQALQLHGKSVRDIAQSRKLASNLHRRVKLPKHPNLFTAELAEFAKNDRRKSGPREPKLLPAAACQLEGLKVSGSVTALGRSQTCPSVPGMGMN